jgi:hypothetical protein
MIEILAEIIEILLFEMSSLKIKVKQYFQILENQIK